MPPKSAKSKKEEALAFLDDLDKLGEEDPSSTEPAAVERSGTPKVSSDVPRKSIDSSRSAVAPASSSSGSTAKGKSSKKALTGNNVPPPASNPATSNPSSAEKPASSNEEDPEAALAYLQAQIDQKRPISRVQTPTTSTPAGRPATPQSATIGSVLPAPTTTRKSIEQTRSRSGTPSNEPTSDPAETSTSGGGWGFKPSFWSSALQTAKSTATSAYTQASQVASAAQSAAIAQVEEKTGVKVNVADLGVDLRGLNLEELRKAGSGGLEALRTRVGEQVKGVDLERLRQDILAGTSHALNELINTVAPPISEHEVVQVWMTHRMKGYDGVESVVYQGVEKMMEQTSSSELEVFFLPAPKGDSDAATGDRSINPLQGWEAGWAAVEKDLVSLKERAQTDGRKGEPNRESEVFQTKQGETIDVIDIGHGFGSADLPITTVPIYLHLQPVLVTLPFPEPPSSKDVDPSVQPKHLTFIVTLHDDVHGLKQSTITQYSPADWMEVDYERSDWVEERLVDVIRVGVEVVVQEYVAVRMGLKATPKTVASEEKTSRPSSENKEATEEKVAKEAGLGT